MRAYFNNNHYPTDDNHSAVIEITPPLDENNNYILSDDAAYGPEHLDWIFTGDFQTPIQGGAFRLPNGNTLITQTHTSKILEVNMDGDEMWEYQYESEFGSDWIARAQKYSPDYLIDLILGDLNMDGVINILDIVMLASLILSGDYSNPAGDLNQDGIQNILDIISLVSLVLN